MSGLPVPGSHLRDARGGQDGRIGPDVRRIHEDVVVVSVLRKGRFAKGGTRTQFPFDTIISSMKDWSDMNSRLLKRDTKGVAVTEYAILLLLAALLSIPLLFAMGFELKNVFGDARIESPENPGGGGGPGGGSAAPGVPAGFDCYDPVNVGEIGPAGVVCEDMLIVDTASLQAAGSNGDGSFDFKPSDLYAPQSNGVHYTFGYDTTNIFTGQVTNMFGLMAYSNENTYIGYWDVSNVTTMSQMFLGNRDFNQFLDNWDVSSVQYMSSMFEGAQSFNSPLNSWDTSSVTDMSYMFADTNFNQEIMAWDTSAVTDMSYMFVDTPFFNSNIGGWDTSNVTTMEGTFSSTFIGSFVSIRRGTRSSCVDSFLPELPVPWEQFGQA